MAIKKVLQDRRYKNRELEIMQLLKHPSVVELKHHFYSRGSNRDEIYLNLVMGFIVPGISWQAHIGGLITGAIVANIMVRTRGEDPKRQRQGLGLVGLGLVALTVLGVVV